MATLTLTIVEIKDNGFDPYINVLLKDARGNKYLALVDFGKDGELQWNTPEIEWNGFCPVEFAGTGTQMKYKEVEKAENTLTLKI